MKCDWGFFFKHKKTQGKMPHKKHFSLWFLLKNIWFLEITCVCVCVCTAPRVLTFIEFRFISSFFICFSPLGRGGPLPLHFLVLASKQWRTLFSATFYGERCSPLQHIYFISCFFILQEFLI